MPSPRAEFTRHARRWWWPTALLAVAPKCVVCVASYAGLGAALGLGAPEVCGATGGSPWAWEPWLAAVSLALGIVAFVSGRVRSTRP